MHIRPSAILGLGLALLAGLLLLWRASSAPDPHNAPLHPVDVSPTATPPTALELEDAPETARSVEAAPDSTIPRREPATRVPSAFTVTGRCVDDSGQPLAGIDVILVTCWTEAEAAGRRVGHGTEPDPIGRDRSNADGRFEIGFDPDPPRPVVRVSIDAKARGFASIHLEEDIADGAVRHELRNIVLQRGVALAGRVRDTNDASIANSRVMVQVRNEFGGYSGRNSATTSRADGSFEIEDAPPGRIRVSARLDDQRTSAPFDLDIGPGEQRRGIEIVMPLYESPLAISGVVVDVDGTPVPRAPLNIMHKASEQFTGSTSMQTDKNGRFRLESSAGTTFQLHASHPEREGLSADLHDVELGRHDLRLQLVARPLIRLLVLDEVGQPVADFAYRVTVTTGNHRTGGLPKPGKRGEALLGAEPNPFEVEISADGHETTRTGLLAPDAIPNPIVVRLPRLPGLRGRVMTEGKPVVRARVHALRGADPSTQFHIEGFRQRIDPGGQGPVTYTDDEGLFALAVATSGPWFVRVSESPFAPMLAGPVEVIVGNATPELKIELVPGGSIMGRTRFESGTVAPDLLIGASCGDGKILTTTSDAEGRYRFEGLAPGGWQLLRLHQAPGNSHSSTSGPDAAPPIEWDCMVASGGITAHDVVLPDEAEVVVKLDPLLEDPVSWSIDAWDAGVSNQESRRADAGPDARTRILKLRSGRWQAATNLTTRSVRLEWVETFEVPAGKSVRTLGLLPGSIRGRVRLPVEPGATVKLGWSGQESGYLEAIADLAADGSFEFPLSVDGTCTIGLTNTPQKEMRRFELKPGEQRDIGEL